MFNDSFYPTPPKIAQHLVAPFIDPLDIDGSIYHRIKAKRILEPSAGKGDILDTLVAQLGWQSFGSDNPRRLRLGDRDMHRRFHTIELEPELQHILRGKGYTVIDSDFLAFHPDIPYDLILMNPPFRNGADHFLHAWQCLGDGGHLACILNAQTLLNPHTPSRQGVLDIVLNHGRFEIHQGAFRDAERKTDVDIAMIWVQKPQGKTYEFGDMEQDEEVREQVYQGQDIASRDAIEALVAQYRVCERWVRQRHEAHARLQYYMKPIRSDYENKDAEKEVEKGLPEEIASLKARFWRFVFESTGIGKQATSKFQEDFRKQMENQQRMSFNERNIYTVLEGFLLNRDTIIQDSIQQVFDKLTHYHQNRVDGEGWKSNKSYRLNHKIVIPYGIRYEYNMWSMSYGQVRELYGDLDKVLCYITGKAFGDILSVEKAMENHLRAMREGECAYDAKFESEFFQLRIFKKGTVHLRFRDQKTCDDFNLAVAKGRNWVGPGF
jgi:hypothetical protein